MAVKIDSPDIIHKADVHCVFLNVRDEAQLITAYRGIMDNTENHNPSAHINGVLVEEMIPGDEGVELIARIKNDAVLGPAIVLGMGGIFVEVFLEKTLLNLSRLVVDFRHVIAEVDINPLIVLEKGVAATDILLIRKETTH